MQAQIVQLEKANLQLELEIQQQDQETEVEKVTDEDEKQAIKEHIFQERPHRSKNAHLPENNSDLTIPQRKQIATKKKAFKAKQRLIKK